MTTIPNPAQYYQQEAQLYYQNQYAEAYNPYGQVAGYGALPHAAPLPPYTSSQNYWKSLRDMVYRPEPSSQNYRLHALQQRAATEDALERTFKIGDAAVSATTSMMALEMAGGWGMSTLGLSGVIAAPIAAYAAMNSTSRYLGLDQATSQFSRIDDLRFESERFMARGYSQDPMRGRMGRRGSRMVNEHLEDYARESSAYGYASVTSDELRQELASLTENGILENVRSAEDFERKFTKLRDGVRRMTEVLGKSFEEGAQMLGELRNINIDPSSGLSVIESVRRLGTQAGLDFDTTFNAAMQGAFQLQGSGLGPRTTAMLGAYGASASSLIYQTHAGNPEHERMLYNLGGEEGVRQLMTQMPAKLKDNPMMRYAFLASYRDGEIDQGRLQGILSGRMDLMKSLGGLPDAQGAINFLGDYTGNYNRFIEDNPDAAIAGYLSMMTSQLRGVGLDEFSSEGALMSTIAKMSDGQFSKEQLQAAMARLRSMDVGAARTGMENMTTGRGRAEDIMETEWLFGLDRLWKGSQFADHLTQTGVGIARSVRGTFFDATEDAKRWWGRKSRGEHVIRSGGLSMAVADDILSTLTPEGGTLESGGHIYRSSGLNSADVTDYFEEMRLGGMLQRRARITATGDTAIVSEDQLRALGATNSHIDDLRSASNKLALKSQSINNAQTQSSAIEVPLSAIKDLGVILSESGGSDDPTGWGRRLVTGTTVFDAYFPEDVLPEEERMRRRSRAFAVSGYDPDAVVEDHQQDLYEDMYAATYSSFVGRSGQLTSEARNAIRNPAVGGQVAAKMIEDAILPLAKKAYGDDIEISDPRMRGMLRGIQERMRRDGRLADISDRLGIDYLRGDSSDEILSFQDFQDQLFQENMDSVGAALVAESDAYKSNIEYARVAAAKGKLSGVKVKDGKLLADGVDPEMLEWALAGRMQGIRDETMYGIARMQKGSTRRTVTSSLQAADRIISAIMDSGAELETIDSPRLRAAGAALQDIGRDRDLRQRFSEHAVIAAAVDLGLHTLSPSQKRKFDEDRKLLLESEVEGSAAGALGNITAAARADFRERPHQMRDLLAGMVKESQRFEDLLLSGGAPVNEDTLMRARQEVGGEITMNDLAALRYEGQRGDRLMQSFATDVVTQIAEMVATNKELVETLKRDRGFNMFGLGGN